MSCQDEPTGWTPKTAVARAVYAAGFTYEPEQQIIFSRCAALQRSFGYAFFYDKVAPLSISAHIHCEPIFFDDSGKHWMVELWKGQYGVETGCEIGVYNRPITPSTLDQRRYEALDWALGNSSKPPDNTIPAFDKFYDCASDEDPLPTISFKLQAADGTPPLFQRGPLTHWWLTGFQWGENHTPDKLTMDVTIWFPRSSTQLAFVAALKVLGYETQVPATGGGVSFTFASPKQYQPPYSPDVDANNSDLVDAYNGLKLPDHDPNSVEDSFSTVSPALQRHFYMYLKQNYEAAAVKSLGDQLAKCKVLFFAFGYSYYEVAEWLRVQGVAYSQVANVLKELGATYDEVESVVAGAFNLGEDLVGLLEALAELFG